MKKFLVVGLILVMGLMFLGMNGYAGEKAETGELRISYGFPFYFSGLQHLMGKNSDSNGGSWMGIGFKKFLKPEVFWAMDFNFPVFYNLHRDDRIDLGIGADLDVKLGAFIFGDFYTVLGPGIAIGEDSHFKAYPLYGIGYEFLDKKDREGFCIEVGMKRGAVYFTASLVMSFKK